MARVIISTPTRSADRQDASLKVHESTQFGAILASAVPPPGIMPSSTAALVALSASSILNFLSFISVSVAAPTLITATPPAKPGQSFLQLFFFVIRGGVFHSTLI
jgi:hypothetical protein